MDTKNVLLIFTKNIMYKPIIYRLALDFEVVFNVLQAKIYPKQEGRLILELRGEKKAVEESITYLKDEGVQVDVLADMIRRDEERCVDCGACIAVCRIDALTLDRPSMEVRFDPEKCIACGMCTRACPVNAMVGTSIDLER